MALKGKMKLFGVNVQNVYLRLQSIAGGKQEGQWTAVAVVFPDASLFDALDQARAALTNAEKATLTAGLALKDDQKNPALISTFEQAKGAEYAASAAAEQAKSALGTPIPVGQIAAPYDANVVNPYLLLYAALKQQAMCAELVDAR